MSTHVDDEWLLPFGHHGVTAEVPLDRAERRFWPAVATIAGLAAIVRLVYVLTDDRVFIGGYGLDYHFGALRLADGLGFTNATLGKVGAAAAHHPPAWGTILGGISWLGGRSIQTHQLVGVFLGLVVVILAAMVGRRYFSARVGIVAAIFAAIYPGFWLLEGNLLPEPLALVLIGVFTLLLPDLKTRPTPARAALVGVVLGLLTLTRSDQLLLGVVVVVPVVLSVRSISMLQRLVRIGVVALMCAAVLAPWTAYNSKRFEVPVLLSTGSGRTLLDGNCTPGSFKGERLGFWDLSCAARITQQHPRASEARLDSLERHAATSNLSDNSDRLPIAVPARIGRLLAIFRPSQTVHFVARWMGVDTWLVWAWVVSFWILFAIAVLGVVMARRERSLTWPLLGPSVVAVVVAVATYGEPQNHVLADLGLVVLAAFAVDRLLRRRSQTTSEAPPAPPSAPMRKPSERVRSKRPERLPSVHIPG